MKILKWLNNFVVLTFLLAGVVIAALISLGVRHDLSKSDWGTWTGSIGTMLTLAWAIQLATASERKADRQERDMAIIAAASIVPTIKQFRDAVVVARAMPLPGTFAAPDNFEEALRDSVRALNHVVLWTRDEITPLVYLRTNAAGDLASIGTAVRADLRTLDAARNSRFLDADEVLRVQEILAGDLQNYAEDLERIQHELTSFLAQHQPNHRSDRLVA